jgi:hypothetical protein
MTWRCPYCGATEGIEAEGLQMWATELVLDENGVEIDRDPYEPIRGLMITSVLCTRCNADDNNGRHWHMTRCQWHKELRARRADYEYDKARDK